MAVLTVEFRSEALVKSTSIKVVFNQNAAPPYPTYYLLHGLSDDASAWTRRTSIERYAENYPFMIIMPDGGRSWYCDSPVGQYETYIVKELVPLIDRLFPTRKQAKYRAIGGLSMGGYGALKLGLKYPRVFGSIAAHSSAVAFAHWAGDDTDITEVPIIAREIDLEANDPFALALKIPAQARPQLYFDCGRSDFLHKENEQFDAFLRKNNFPHTYRRYNGAHDWSYWDIHIQDAMSFHAKAMGL